MNNSEEIVEKIVARLLSEGVTIKNYSTEKATAALQGCVMPNRLIKFLTANEGEVVKLLALCELSKELVAFGLLAIAKEPEQFEQAMEKVDEILKEGEK